MKRTVENPVDSFRQRAMTGGGTIPAGEGWPAFSITRQASSPIPILIAAPHAGRRYPADLTSMLRAPAQAALRLEDRLIDLVARQAAGETGARLLIAHAPRAMIDLNRAVDDVDWDMIAGTPPTGAARHAAGRRARSGLGLVPRRLSDLGELWHRRLSSTELEERIEKVHRPYHEALAATLAALRDQWGEALLIDLHSMPPLGAKRGRNRAADFVLGDRFGAACDTSLMRVTRDHFDRAGYITAHNRPYAGGYVLDRHGAPMRGINAMQIEVCRTLYLDKAMRNPSGNIGDVVHAIASLVRRLADEMASRGQMLGQAAE